MLVSENLNVNTVLLYIQIEFGIDIAIKNCFSYLSKLHNTSKCLKINSSESSYIERFNSEIKKYIQSEI